MNISKDSSEILELFFRDSHTCFVLLDRDFNFIRVNEAYAEVCARDISEFPGHNHFEMYPSDAQAIFEEVREKKEPYEVFARPFEFPDHPEWGVTYWDWRLEPILDDQGEVEMFVFSLNNVTNHALAIQEITKLKDEMGERVNELRESEARLSQLLTSSPVVIYTSKASGNYAATYISPNVKELMGVDPEDFLSDPGFWADNIHPDDAPRVFDDLNNLFEHGKHTHDYRFRKPDGSYMWVHDELNLIYGDDGGPKEVIGSWSDITERKQAEKALKNSHDELERRVEQRTAELKHAKEDAEKANLAKTKFLAAASHDLRQPLQAAHLFLWALSAEEQQPKNRQIISNIEASVESLDNLLNSLLDISRLEAGLIEPSMRAVSISPMMKRLTDEYSHIARDEGVEIRSVMTKASVYTDPGLLESILRNLLSNAVKHAERGKVLLGCRNHGDSITVEVWDNGHGIPEDRLNDIFGEFVQIGNEGRDRSKGLGLGLSIIEKLAGLLDHRIDVRSWEGNGSAFTIELPLAHEDAVSERLEEAPATKPLAEVSAFIIEDEPAIRNSLSLVLEQKGYKVHATSGHDCQECKKITSEMTAPPDIIIADFRLQHGHSGIDAVKCLRETFKKDIPAILLTGDTAPNRLVEARSSGLPILHKPINVDDLLQAIATAIKADE